MRRYLKSLYTRTMDQAYERAIKEILQSLDAGEGVWIAELRKAPCGPRSTGNALWRASGT